MSRDNMIGVPLHLQPNSDWLVQSGAGLFMGFVSIAGNCPQFNVASGSPALLTNSTSLPSLSLFVVENYQAVDGMRLMIDNSGGTVRQMDTSTAYRSKITNKVAGQVQHTRQFNISPSTFNNWNKELLGKDKYPHSRRSGLPPGRARIWHNQPSPGSEDIGGTTVS